MVATDIDKVNGYVIRRLHSPDRLKTYGYITVKHHDTGAVDEVKDHPNLTAARIYAGAPPAKSTSTPAKTSYAQNRKGYRADNQKVTKK